MDGVCKEMAHHIQKQINHAKSIKETKKEMITSACIIYTQKERKSNNCFFFNSRRRKWGCLSNKSNYFTATEPFRATCELEICFLFFLFWIYDVKLHKIFHLNNQ